MFRTSLMFGLIAGIIVVIPMLLGAMTNPEGMIAGGHALGYLMMLIALSTIFVGVKRYRDGARGGVIKFLPAFLVGLGITAVAGVIYVIGWEVTLAVTNYEFMEIYSRTMIEAERAKGVSGPDLDAFIAQMQSMTEQYRNPAFRLPITFLEIFPVGLIISLIAAALLRNPRFLPARGTPAAG
jgi:uncharacterized membrane protein YhaH (DUF805 family)